MVGADGEAPEVEEVVALGLGVLVEQDRLVAAASWLAGVDGVLLALLGTRGVLPGPERHGWGQVGLLDAGLDLFVQVVDEPGGGRHHRCGVGVLGLEVGDHRRVVAITQPVPLIDPGIAVVGQGRRPALGNGSDGRVGVGGGGHRATLADGHRPRRCE